MRGATLLAVWALGACRPAPAPVSVPPQPARTPGPTPQGPVQSSPPQPSPADLVAAHVQSNAPIRIDFTTFHWTLGEAVRVEAGEVPSLATAARGSWDGALPLLGPTEAVLLLPAQIGGLGLARAIDHGDHVVGLYTPDDAGGTVVLAARRRGKVLAFVDFDRYRFEPGSTADDGPGVDQRVQWARVRDGVLFVSQSHPSPGTKLDGYLGAFDADTGEVRWRTEASVSNLENFVFHDGYVFTGYADAQGKHVIHAVRMADGSVEQRREIGSRPVSLAIEPPYLKVSTADGPMTFRL